MDISTAHANATSRLRDNIMNGRRRADDGQRGYSQPLYAPRIICVCVTFPLGGVFTLAQWGRNLADLCSNFYRLNACTLNTRLFYNGRRQYCCRPTVTRVLRPFAKRTHFTTARCPPVSYHIAIEYLFSIAYLWERMIILYEHNILISYIILYCVSYFIIYGQSSSLKKKIETALGSVKKNASTCRFKYLIDKDIIIEVVR